MRMTQRELLESFRQSNKKQQLLRESLSQRQFWDFYAVYADGLQDHPEIDVNYIVDTAWNEIFNEYVKLIFGRVGRPAVLTVARKTDVEDYDEDFSELKFTKSIQKSHKQKFRDMYAAKTPEQQLAVIKWFLNEPGFTDGTYRNIDVAARSGGNWHELAKKIVAESSKRNASRSAKAMSIDRMIGWTHHSGLLTDYIGKWLEPVLNARAYGNMNTLLAHASPDVRNALKSATYGVGRPQHTIADDVEAVLNRNDRVKRVKRHGNQFVIDYLVHAHYYDASTSNTELKTHLNTFRFTVTADGLLDDSNTLHKFMYDYSNGAKVYKGLANTLRGMTNDNAVVY